MSRVRAPSPAFKLITAKSEVFRTLVFSLQPLASAERLSLLFFMKRRILELIVPIALLSQTLLAEPPLQSEEFTEFASAIQSGSQEARKNIIMGWINGTQGQNLTPEELANLFLPLISRLNSGTLIKEDLDEQGLLGVALRQIGVRFGPKAKVLTPTLLALVRDPHASSYWRSVAITMLPHIEGSSETVIAALIVALKDGTSKTGSGVHSEACQVLGAMGKKAAASIPALLLLLKPGASLSEDDAFIALAKISEDYLAKPFNEQIKILSNLTAYALPQRAAAFLAIERARELNDAQLLKARKVLATILTNHKSDIYAKAALRTLQGIGPGSSPDTVRALINAMIVYRLREASPLLEKLDGVDVEAIAELTAALPKALHSIALYYDTEAIAKALGTFGAKARSASPFLIETLRSHSKLPPVGTASSSMLASLIETLAIIDPDNPLTADVFIELLENRTEAIDMGRAFTELLRCKLHDSLGQFSGLATLPALVKRMVTVLKVDIESPDLALRSCAAFSAGNTASPEVVPLLVNVLNIEAPDQATLSVTSQAVSALKRLGVSAQSAEPELRKIAAYKLPDLSFSILDSMRRAIILEARSAVED